MDDGGTLFCEPRYHLSPAAKYHQHHGFARLNQLFYVLLLSARQTQALAVAVLAAEHHILADGSDDDICLTGHCKGFCLVGVLAGIDFAVEDFILPGTLVAKLVVLRLNLFGPVATAGIHHVHALRLAPVHTL